MSSVTLRGTLRSEMARGNPQQSEKCQQPQLPQVISVRAGGWERGRGCALAPRLSAHLARQAGPSAKRSPGSRAGPASSAFPACALRALCALARRSRGRETPSPALPTQCFPAGSQLTRNRRGFVRTMLTAAPRAVPSRVQPCPAVPSRAPQMPTHLNSGLTISV